MDVITKDVRALAKKELAAANWRQQTAAFGCSQVRMKGMR